MVNCIICHMEILSNLDSFHACPNGHQVHESCLKEWLANSFNCPLCREPYSSNVTDKFRLFLKEKEIKEKAQIKAQIKEEQLKEMQKATERVILLKLKEETENLIRSEQFEKALDYLDTFKDVPISSLKGQAVLFLKGKVNYHRGRYDLAISHLFKLVKEKFDFPDAFLYLGKSYEALGLLDKAKWAFERVK